jgi:hypothetical protein
MRFLTFGRRESLRFADWTALYIFQWRRFRLARKSSRGIDSWWSSAIMALAVRWSWTFFETPDLTTRSTSTAASMLGLATSTNQCRAIDSVSSKREICDACR